MENIGWLCIGFMTGFFFCLTGIIIIICNVKTNFNVKIIPKKEK